MKSFSVCIAMQYVGTLGRFLKAYIRFTRLEFNVELMFKLIQHALNGDREQVKIFNIKVYLVIGIIFQSIFYLGEMDNPFCL